MSRRSARRQVAGAGAGALVVVERMPTPALRPQAAVERAVDVRERAVDAQVAVQPQE
jgi:hypothetical protein